MQFLHHSVTSPQDTEPPVMGRAKSQFSPIRPTFYTILVKNDKKCNKFGIFYWRSTSYHHPARSVWSQNQVPTHFLRLDL